MAICKALSATAVQSPNMFHSDVAVICPGAFCLVAESIGPLVIHSGRVRLLEWKMAIENARAHDKNTRPVEVLILVKLMEASTM